MLNSYLARLHFIIFLWGFTAILGKIITLEASALVWYRMLLTSSILLVFVFFFQKETIKIPKKLFFKLLGVGFLMALHWLFFFQSIKVSNVSIALSCISTTTLFTAITEPIVYKRRLDWLEIIIGIVIVLGMILIFKTEIQYKEGIFYGILCALLASIFSVFNGKLHGSTTSGNIIFYEIFGGFLALSGYFGLTGELLNFTQISWVDFWWVLLLAGLFTAYPMFESIRLMKHISPFTLVLAVNLEPIYGVVFAYLIFGESEHMSPIFYMASAVMLAAIFLNGFIKSRRK
ncbi:DMT family transporter [Capnocytophaga canimorsus]|uniref:EamA/RhaT family transporter n=1 Tax=Capnocytophaga canimorsus TaxID=28188 RepID=A0A0B7INC7_9FLAO|nr:DMT family transporter [Capnocytophaga canimorsus]ATA92065.1 EamA/RhaT family transporter [Capnocytophaga canimorsus]GIM59595.1 permease [Capnocytophaga canimorsus]GJQ03837.1 permease [Capnocytophaga canimorsus]CEN51517.1 Predicted permease [Capnocytophaga canimorsus]